MIEGKDRTLTRRLSFISWVNRALAREGDKLLVEIHDLAIQYRTFELCWAGFIDPEQSMAILYMARNRNNQLPEIPGITQSPPRRGRRG